ncbi:MAG: cobalamin B12-binding domain-containing protein [Elusimicrobia bacterium]|nr:cobalamin B12-binding domain-containing protein [Elusimicrobiota bacterium]
MTANAEACDIVIVYPPVVRTGRYSQVATGHEIPPQPLINLGAVLRQRGFKVRLLDANALGLTPEETTRRILGWSPRFVGITAPTMLISTAGRIAKAVKDSAPDIVTIVGGPHLTAVPKETMESYPGVDIGVIGEGENTILELLQSIERKSPLDGVKGIIYRGSSGPRRTPPRPFIQDLDTLPFPAWDMLPDLLERYQQSAARIGRLPNVSIITSRGCPFQCIFCNRTVFGNVTRAHSADYVMRMIRRLIERYRIKSISFEDDNFVVFRKRLVDLCERLVSEGVDIVWDCASNVNAVQPEILALMRKAGCWQINYGIESGSQRILDFIRKGTTLKKIQEALAMTRAAGINTKGYFIIGHPTETLESIQETIDFVKRIDLDIFQMSFMVPFPGTELHAMADRYGSFAKELDHMHIWTPQFIPHGLSKETMEKESMRAYREFYFRPRPIYGYLKRSLRPSVAAKFVKDGLRILRFLLGNSG